MKKVLLAITLLTCIISSTFALSAKIVNDLDYRTVIVYDDNRDKVLEYSRPKLCSIGLKIPLGGLYSISWYKDGATTEQIKEWKEFAKLFVEEEK